MSKTAYETKQVTRPTRGFKLKFTVPSNLAAFDLAAGYDGAAYEHAVDEGMYRSVLPKLWKKVLEKAPERWGLERPQVGVRKNKAGDKETPVFQDIKDYLPALKKHCADNIAELTAWLQELVDEIGFDLSSSSRERKPAKEFIEKAQDLIQQITAGKSDDEIQAAIASSSAKFASRGITDAWVRKEDGNIDEIVLAGAIRDYFAADDSLV